MARIRSSFDFILVFLVASVSLLLLSHGSPAVDFHQWCKRTTHEGYCLSAILADRRDYLKTSPSGFCTILNDRSRQEVISAISKVDGLLQGGEVPLLERQILQKCYDDYNRALQNLDAQNFTVVNYQTYQNANIRSALVFDRVSACESSFKPPISSPVDEENRISTNLSETIAEILNLNQCNQTSACLQQ